MFPVFFMVPDFYQNIVKIYNKIQVTQHGVNLQMYSWCDLYLKRQSFDLFLFLTKLYISLSIVLVDMHPINQFFENISLYFLLHMFSGLDDGYL